MIPAHEKEVVDDFIFRLESQLLNRYLHYVNQVNKSGCEIERTSIENLKFDAFRVSVSSFKEAIGQIGMDIRIILMRRGNLIGDLRPSEGKIAGIIAFRLARASIIHLGNNCLNCKLKCLDKTNIKVAIRCALDYIRKKYPKINDGLRKELVYTMRHRHVNQETLGLVFDTLQKLPDE